MASINDFVDHRWADAKAKLEKLDGEFVTRAETAIQLEELGLTAPSILDDGSKPIRWLSKSWHRLLEDCLELTMQVSLLETAAVSLTGTTMSDNSSKELGKCVDYHFRSWFIHADTLAKRACGVIDKTTSLYLNGRVEEADIAKRHKRSVYEQVTVLVENQRNAYAHGTTRSWASGITEDKLWEGLVARGMTPTRFLEEFRYPTEEASLMAAKYDWFVDATTTVCDRLGLILHSLELDVDDRWGS